jgi:hypothetical protein
METQEYIFINCENRAVWNKKVAEFKAEGFKFSKEVEDQDTLNIPFMWDIYKEKTNLVINKQNKRLFLMGQLI